MQVALLLSIIRKAGIAPNWKDVDIPAGRTMQASAKMYSELIKASAGVEMTSGESVTPSKKRPRGGKAGGMLGEDGEPVKKKRAPRGKKRAKVVEAEGGEVGGDEEAGEELKMVKVEGGEDGEGVDGEAV